MRDTRNIRSATSSTRWRHAVLPIIMQYLPRKPVVWCPFDTENSEFVIALKEAGHAGRAFAYLHGQDFKAGTSLSGGHHRLQSSVQPEAAGRGTLPRAGAVRALLSNLWLSSSAPCRFFKEREMQMLLFDKRINYSEKNAVYFGSSYFCYKVLPKQIVFENLTTVKEKGAG